jgi:uncharacterized phage protein (TIGR01671 family)
MTREIKFRAWDKKHKRFTAFQYTSKVENDIQIFYLTNQENITYMQYTGLKDKNGVEIYEGDIVKIGKELIEEIKWVDESNWNDTKCSVNGWVNHESIYTEKPEVIGNIYQNPELLN